MAKEEMTDYYVCEICKEYTKHYCAHKKPHKEIVDCGHDYGHCTFVNKTICKQMSVAEYAVWRLTK